MKKLENVILDTKKTKNSTMKDPYIQFLYEYLLGFYDTITQKMVEELVEVIYPVEEEDLTKQVMKSLKNRLKKSIKLDTPMENKPYRLETPKKAFEEIEGEMKNYLELDSIQEINFQDNQTGVIYSYEELKEYYTREERETSLQDFLGDNYTFKKNEFDE